MNEKRQRVAELLDVCTQVEETVAEIYEALASAHAEDAALAACWTKAAADEVRHAQQFRLFPRLQHAMIVDLALDVRSAYALLDFVRRYQTQVRVAPPGFVDALRFAVEMEQAMAQVHMEHAVSFSEQAHRQMFAAMTDFDRGHILMLEQELEDRLARPSGESQRRGAAALSKK